MTLLSKTAAAAVALSLTGCAGSMPAADQSITADQTSFTGWVRVSEGEFQLFPTQRQLSEPFSRPCISGALPRNAQRAADDLNGSQVTFTGRTAPWTQATNQILRHEGSVIVNHCRGDLVILADDVRVNR